MSAAACYEDPMNFITPAGESLLRDPMSDKEISSAPSILSRLRAIASEGRKTLKESGVKGLLRRYGWKVLALVLVYYLVRDTLLYLILPYLIARNFF